MLRRQGEAGFRVVTWDQALDRLAGDLRMVDPARAAFFLTSRGITNEVYYAAQKAAPNSPIPLARSSLMVMSAM